MVISLPYFFSACFWNERIRFLRSFSVLFSFCLVNLVLICPCFHHSWPLCICGANFSVSRVRYTRRRTKTWSIWHGAIIFLQIFRVINSLVPGALFPSASFALLTFGQQRESCIPNGLKRPN